MSRWLAVVILLACGAPLARADSFPALRIGVLKFETTDAAINGATASDLFSTALYRNFPGLSVVERARIEAAISKEKLNSDRGRVDQETAELLQSAMGLDSLVSGSIMALDKNANGDGGTLMLSARLVKLSSGEILWADTRTVRLQEPLLKRMWGTTPKSGLVLTEKLLELAVFQLVQDLGKRLPEEALSATGRRGAAGRTDHGNGCIPPPFYEFLPRDSDWFYGVGKDPDTNKARDSALVNLAKQVTGNVGSWNDSRIKEREVADKIEELPPESSPLVGWEQDDYRRCNGVSYVLVRIGKERVRNFISANARLANTVPPPFTDKIPSARALKEISRANVARSAMIYSDLMSPGKNCGARGCRSAPTRAETILIAGARRKLAAGTITATDVVQVGVIYLKYSKDGAEREFFDAVIYRRLPLPSSLTEDYEQTRELTFPLAWDAALMRKDWQSFFKYCADYLRRYPNGSYAATAEKNRENAAKILMLRNHEPPSGFDLADQD